MRIFSLLKHKIKTTLFLVITVWSSLSHADWYHPNSDTSAQIQLKDKINLTYHADLYDVDLFDTSKELIQEMKDSGKHVVCYFSAGSYENWRQDKKKFLKKEVGKALDGWEGEWWIDIRSANVKKIMQARLNLAVQKGCEGVDPDNVDGYSNSTGFYLKPQDQLSYNSFLAKEAHKRGLSIGLKNDLLQIVDLVKNFDFSINEQCHQFDECNYLQPFIDAKKPVFNLEYNIKDSTEQASICANSRKHNIRTLIMPEFLDGSFRISCDD